jgi:hypothetical protein
MSVSTPPPRPISYLGTVVSRIVASDVAIGSEYVYLCIPYYILNAGARSFRELNSRQHANVSRAYLCVMSIFLKIAQAARAKTDAKNVRMTLTLHRDLVNAPVMIVFFLYISTEKSRSPITDGLAKLINPKVFDVDAAADGTGEGSTGLMVRSESTGSANGPGGPERAGSNGSTGSKRPRDDEAEDPDARSPYYSRPTAQSWARFVDVIVRQSPGAEKDDPRCLAKHPKHFAESENCYNPMNAFSINKMLSNAKVLKAVPDDFTSTAKFFDFDGQGNREGFVWHRDTHHISPAALTPQTLCNVYFPWVPRPNKSVNKEREYFINFKGPRIESTDDAVCEDKEAVYRATLEEEACYGGSAVSAGELYDTSVHVQPLDDENMTLRKMSIANREKVVDLLQYRGDLPVFRAKRAALQVALLGSFMEEIWNSDQPHIQTSIRSISKWGESYLCAPIQENRARNFCMPMKKATTNLSRMGDRLAMKAAGLEAFCDINTSHHEIMFMWLACMHLYLCTDFHCHILQTGPPQAGKSHSLVALLWLLIIGTYNAISYSTLRAKTGKSPDSDLSIEVFEEIKPEQIGANCKKQSNGVSNEGDLALFKSILTSGKASVQELLIDPVTKERVLRLTERDCRSVYLAAANVMPHSDRQDGPGLAARLGRDQSLNPSMIMFATKMQRNQYLHALVNMLIHVKILEPVKMAVGHILLGAVLERAKAKNASKTDDARHYNRTMFICHSLVVESAIDTLFDLPDSPLRDLPWAPQHILLIEKHLVCKTEHIVMAIGMTEHQWEDRVSLALSNDFSVYFGLRDAISHRERSQQVLHKATLAENRAKIALNRARSARKMVASNAPNSQKVTASNLVTVASAAYDKACAAVRQAGASIANFMLPVSSDDTYWIMDSELMQEPYKHCERSDECLIALSKQLEMHRKQGVADKIEILSCLKRMASETIRLPDREEQVPMLQFINTTSERRPRLDTREHSDSAPRATGKYIYSWKLLVAKVAIHCNPDRAVGTSRIYDCVREVLHHRHAETATYLYGVTNPLHPYSWETIHVEANSSYPELVAIQANYYNPSLVLLASNYVEGLRMQNISHDDQKAAEKAYREVSQFRKFDMNLDIYGTIMHDTALGLTDEEGSLIAGQYPSNESNQLGRQLAKRRCFAPPDRFYPRDFVEVINRPAEARANPQSTADVTLRLTVRNIADNEPEYDANDVEAALEEQDSDEAHQGREEGEEEEEEEGEGPNNSRDDVQNLESLLEACGTEDAGEGEEDEDEHAYRDMLDREKQNQMDV